jgi:hypothetical protein
MLLSLSCFLHFCTIRLKRIIQSFLGINKHLMVWEYSKSSTVVVNFLADGAVFVSCQNNGPLLHVTAEHSELICAQSHLTYLKIVCK